MKFKGQMKINICGFEYKRNIADSRGGGGVSEHPKKKPVSAPERGMWLSLHGVDSWRKTEICSV